MYYVSKRMEIAGAHRLDLDYPSKCCNLHGHNWIITVHCRAENLNRNGMVVDFTDIKKKIHDRLDHKYLNDLLAYNPTAENIARWVCNTINYENSHAQCYRVEVQESEGNIAVYEVDE